MLQFPFNAAELLRKKKSLRRELAAAPNLVIKRVAILGGSTTTDFKDCLELFLLNEGIQPEFYESDYNKFYEDGAFGNPKLDSFQPELAVIFTTVANIRRWPELAHTQEEARVLAEEELSRLRAVWDGISSRHGCTIVQNNFELPQHRIFGNADVSDFRGRVNFVNHLNSLLVEESQRRKYLRINDLNFSAATFGLEKWFDRAAWHAYKMAFSAEAVPSVAHSVSAILKSIWGKSKKCLVLDLDNTLWGGVIGDDGQDGIRIGGGSTEAEAYSEFQDYLKQLHERGILLAVCSKNDHANALSGLNHPDSKLKPEVFSAIRANWNPKSHNIAELAHELNIGLDSLVFVDDNPAERDIVRTEVPRVSVPEIGAQVENYARILEGASYFETVSISQEDLVRTKQYGQNAQRKSLETNFQNYDDFLRSLQMHAEIAPFSPVYLDRIFQLANKTNQFNLTTRRYTREEMDAVSKSKNQITLYGKLADKFGDNGLISLVAAEVSGNVATIALWLMSCRVLKRGMEQAMMDALVLASRARGVTTIKGSYLKTPKNQMVEGLLGELGFTLLSKDQAGNSDWIYSVPEQYELKNTIIRVTPNEHEHTEPSAGNLS